MGREFQVPIFIFSSTPVSTCKLLLFPPETDCMTLEFGGNGVRQASGAHVVSCATGQWD